MGVQMTNRIRQVTKRIRRNLGQNALVFGFKRCADKGASSQGSFDLMLNGKAVLKMPARSNADEYTIPYAGDLQTLTFETKSQDAWAICELRLQTFTFD